MRTETEKQQSFEHYILNHLPKDFMFNEDYGCYPMIFVDVKDTKEAKELLEKEFLLNHFSTEMVEVETYEEDPYKQIELLFNLQTFTEARMKQCLQLAYNALAEADLIGKCEETLTDMIKAAEIEK